MLDTWEALAPLHPGGFTIDELQAETTLPDGRMQTYEPGVIFLRRCEATELLLTHWRGRIKAGSVYTVAFAEALHAVKPLFMPLPSFWAGEKDRHRSRRRQIARERERAKGLRSLKGW